MFGQYYEVVEVVGRDVTLARRGERGMYSCDPTLSPIRRVRIIEGVVPAVGTRINHPCDAAGRGQVTQIEYLD